MTLTINKKTYEAGELAAYVEELEQENAELKYKLKNLASVAEVRLANWQKYEKENADLKDFINAPLTKGRTTTRKEMFQSIWELSKKLTTAKDLLKRWVDDRVYTVSEQKDLIADTEQFLEEK